MVGRQKKHAESYLAQIQQQTGLQRDEINEALHTGQLEQRIRLSLNGNSSDTLQAIMKEAASLIELHEKISDNETKAIKRGLDLQGGTYLVYEVNLPKLMRDVAKNKDARFEEIMRGLDQVAKTPNLDYFEACRRSRRWAFASKRFPAHARKPMPKFSPS
jgi:preprotein translocase subunit SecD